MRFTTARRFENNPVDFDRLGGPYLEFEISECGYDLQDIIEAVERKYPGARFAGTEKRYESCIMAVFEYR